MQARLKPRLPSVPYSTEFVDPEVVELDWYRRGDSQASDGEAELCAKYGASFSISRREADRIEAFGGRVVHLPMSMPCGREGNLWDRNAILAAGPNSFNVQGYLWFASKVLPKLMDAEPGFRLDLTGTLSTKVAPVNGIDRKGIVPDLGEHYLRSRFAICPVFGGTGQQIKIVEAMAWGAPVVSLADPARESPLVHGINGFICSDEHEFMEACLSLWRDQELRERMGRAARESVSRELHPSLYASKVKAVLDSMLDQ